jgi:hypothetical protein
MTRLAELAWRSAALYRKAGHPDSAAQVLERAGQSLTEKARLFLKNEAN